MQCPKCQAAMRSYERNGITIDQCTECRGIFLDRGELDHLISLEAAQSAPAPPAAAPPQQPSPPPAYTPQTGYQQGYQQYGGKPPKRKKSFLEDLFD